MAESWDDSAPAAQVAELPEIKLFGKWSSEDVQVSDISLTVSVLHVTFNLKSMSYPGFLKLFSFI